MLVEYFIEIFVLLQFHLFHSVQFDIYNIVVYKIQLHAEQSSRA